MKVIFACFAVVAQVVIALPAMAQLPTNPFNTTENDGVMSYTQTNSTHLRPVFASAAGASTVPRRGVMP